MARLPPVLLLGTMLALSSSCAPRIPRGLEPCGAELQRLCGEVEPGAGRLLACLRGHEGELSPGCRQRVTLLSPPDDTTPMGPQAFQACQGDIRVHCTGVTPGEGRLKHCLVAHGAQVSPPCRAALEAEAGAVRAGPEP